MQGKEIRSRLWAENARASPSCHRVGEGTLEYAMPLLSVHWYRDGAKGNRKGDRKMGMMQEFEEFAVKGNVIDLAGGSPK